MNILWSSSYPKAFDLNNLKIFSYNYPLNFSKSSEFITYYFTISIDFSISKVHSYIAFSPSALQTNPQAESISGTLPPFIVSVYANANYNNIGPVKIDPCRVFGFNFLKIF